MNKHIGSALPLLLAPLLTACVGTTGSGLVDFDAYASGPSDAAGAPGSPHSYTFFSPYTGYTITLTTATLQIGAVYLDATPCVGGSGVPPCVNQNAATVAQVNGGTTGAYGVQTAGLLLDALSADPQPFPAPGNGIIQQAQSAEVWLATADGNNTDGIDDVSDAPRIADVTGTAEKDGMSIAFTASVTIGANRLLPASNPALPGANPICQQRIVRPICLTPPLEPEPGTSFHVQVDPKGWFNNVDFSTLAASGSPPYAIPDSNDDVNGHDFFQGLESSSGVYSFSFQPP
jgi:hypothetical protein